MLPAFSLLLLIAIVLTACSAQEPSTWKLVGRTMGTYYHITVTHPEQLGGMTKQQLQDTVEQRLVLINQQMSTYITDSDLSRFNQAPINTDVKVSPALASLVQRSIDLYRDSGGSFDPTVGSLVNLWGFGPGKHNDDVPPAAEIAHLVKIHGMNKVSVDLAHHTMRKTSDVYVDLSANAKGDGVDRIAELLEALGAKDYLVEIGGELRGHGLNDRGTFWQIAIEQPPASASLESVYHAIAIENTSVATSGDYRNYFEENGKRYSHTIDPRTGYPITHSLASVTVIAPSCGDADGLATAINVMGPDKGMAFANKHALAVYMMVRTKSSFEARSSRAFKPFLTEN